MPVLRVGVAPDSLLNPECFVNDTLLCDPGVELTLIHMIAKLLNVTVDIVHSEYHKKGRLHSLHHLLETDVIDMTGNSFIPSQSRTKSVDVSLPLLQHKQAYLIRRPAASDVFMNFNPLASFSKTVWLFLFLVFSVMPLVVGLLHYAGFGQSIARSVMAAVGDVERACFMYYRPPRRIIWFCGLLFMAAVKLAYSTYIWAALMYPYPTKLPFRNIKELAQQLRHHRYRFAEYHGAVMFTDFSCTDDPAANSSLVFNFETPPTPHMWLSKLLEHDDLVFVADRVKLLQYMQGFPDHDKLLLIVDDQVELKYRCFFWQKNFSLGNAINQAIIFMEDFKENLRYRFTNGGREAFTWEKTLADSQERRSAVSLNIIKGPLISLCVMLGISLATLTFEMLVWFYKSHRS
ncbi:unnamed protein product [Soboliphyme baturini]|uniref:Lig_chan-Glu_bd domain-containing protein n=1 Tax=Soboliphyme baturini TaxID=241478 RepID=A0A183IMZ2_9BILA|nr:unnamed protein product [Soboliphyme baturini]